MAFTPEEIRAALIRSRAKKFAAQLRMNRMAEYIPEVDQEWLKDEEIPAYKEVLVQQGCTMRKIDLRWESQR